MTMSFHYYAPPPPTKRCKAIVSSCQFFCRVVSRYNFPQTMELMSVSPALGEFV